MAKIKSLKIKNLIGIMALCFWLFCNCSGSGSGSADLDNSGKVAIFGEAQYDAGYTFDK